MQCEYIHHTIIWVTLTPYSTSVHEFIDLTRSFRLWNLFATIIWGPYQYETARLLLVNTTAIAVDSILVNVEKER